MSDPKSLNVFISYSHRDEDLREALGRHLSMLEYQGLIDIWHDRMIVGGTEWASEIKRHLESADVILLLISPDFLASEQSRGETKQAMERREGGMARVIPILLRPVDWSGAKFSELQVLPRNKKPVTSWSNRDEAFTEVVNELRREVEGLQNQLAQQQPLPTPAPPAAAGLTSKTLREEGLLDELASVFDSEASVKSLLESAGVPAGRVKPFGLVSPVEYWESVCRDLEKGMTRDGLAGLLRAASAAYEYNPKFKRGLELI